MAQNKLNVDIIYPIGSIYMSVNSTNPNTLFGGTWEQLKDRFLLGAGNTYTNGSTGGEAVHTLTEAEMPAHKHRLGLRYAAASGGNWTAKASEANGGGGYGYSDDAGGGQAHNNMPPYLVVYMWKRTA